jgi:hypothetical protein
MKLFNKVILVLTIVLSLATGVFKVLQQKADIELFEKIGFGAFGTTLLGLIQIIGGIYLIFPKYRKYGALVMIGTFSIATIAVFVNKMYVFGIVSILFISMALFIYINTLKNEKKS